MITGTFGGSLELLLISRVRLDLSEELNFGFKFLGWLWWDDSWIQDVCFSEVGLTRISETWKILGNNSFYFLLLSPKFFGGIEEASLMGTLNGE